MSKYTLEEISKAMRHIDICMLTTKAGDGLESRPMSNNKDVDYDGDSYFFTMGNNNVSQEITADNNVSLSYIHQPTLSKTFIFLSKEKPI